VIDSDKILVMGEGRLLEYERPSILLQDKTSELFKMVSSLGDIEASRLTKLAN
jgi:hypothetical protein